MFPDMVPVGDLLMSEGEPIHRRRFAGDKAHLTKSKAVHFCLNSQMQAVLLSRSPASLCHSHGRAPL
jgi:hypothetical protein